MKEKDKKKEIMEEDLNLLKIEHVLFVVEWNILLETADLEMEELQKINPKSSKDSQSFKTKIDQ